MTEPSLIEILKGFEKHHFRYLLIGGHAVNQYGSVTITRDFDFWIAPEEKEKVVQYLTEKFPFDVPSEDALKRPILTLYGDWQKIDLFLARRFSNTEGKILDFDQCFERSIKIEDSEEKLSIILPAIDDLIALKKMRQTPRSKDLEDIAFLESLKNEEE